MLVLSGCCFVHPNFLGLAVPQWERENACVSNVVSTTTKIKNAFEPTETRKKLMKYINHLVNVLH